MRTPLASILVCVAASIAGAAPSEVYLEVKTAPGTVPVIEATVIDASLASVDNLAIREASSTAKPIKAVAVTPYSQGGEPMTLAIVYAGNEVFLGNDDFETDENARYSGILHALEKGLDDVHLAQAFPTGSRAIAIAYDAGARIVIPMGPMAAITGKALGDQRSYRAHLGTDLVSGIELAVAELSRTSTPRKALVVIGDGNDTNNEVAATALAELKKRAAQANIQTYAIIYKGALSQDGEVLPRMIPRARTIASAEALPAALTTVMSQLANRYYVTFPATGFALDGRTHELTVSINGEDTEPVALTMPLAASEGCHLSAWWKQIMIGTVLVGLLVLGTMLTWRASSRHT